MLPWVLCIILFILVLLLSGKILLLQKGIVEICDEFKRHLSIDTNALIYLSTGDKHLRALAVEINKELRLLRKQRHKYIVGDAELKEAVTSISHDLRTPLTAICGYLELLEQEEKNEVVNQYLVAIENRVEALKTLTEELFRYSVILSESEDLPIKQVNLNAILEESLGGMYAAFKSREITPHITMPEEPVFCKGNKTALERVFNNLLSNALKYSDGDLVVSLSKDGTSIFSNEASRLSEVEVRKLFHRFYTVDSARNSNGLGLSIVKHLIDQMDWKINAEYRGSRLIIMIKPNE